MTTISGTLSGERRGVGLRWWKWAGHFVLFLACSLLVFVVFSHYYPVLEGSLHLYGRIGVTLAFLVLAVLARRSVRYRSYWPVLLAFGTSCAAISLDYKLSLSRWLLPALNVSIDTPIGLAIEKLESSMLGVLVVLAFTLASGQKLTSLRLRRGRLGLGLAIGLGALLIMAASAMRVAELVFGGHDLSWQRLLPWTPWVLIFVLANAFNEELLFRGLFLGRLEPFLGRIGANLLIAIPFTLMHTGVDYAPDLLLFLGMTFPLALAWGWLAQKTQSLWGSVLFHAAMDIPIVVGIFSVLA